MIIDSLVSALKNIPFPSLSSTWKGRQITVLTLGALSLGLVAFLIKKLFWKPAPEAPRPDKNQPASPPEEPAEEVLSNSIMIPARTPGRSKLNQSVAPTPVPPPEIDIRRQSLSLDNRFPVLFRSARFSSPISFGQKGTNLTTELFPQGSKFYVNGTITTPELLSEDLSNNAEHQEIDSFLLHLDEIAKITLKYLYSFDFFDRGGPLAHKPLLCSVCKEETGISIRINNLLYSYQNYTHQLHLFALKEGDNWFFDEVDCTTWDTEIPMHPLTMNLPTIEAWTPFVKASQQRGFCFKTHPLMEKYIGSFIQGLPSFTIDLNNENEGRLAPIFEEKNLQAVCGDLLGIESFNCSNLLQSLLEREIVDKATLTILTENQQLKPQIFRHNNQVFTHLFLKASDSNVFEVGLQLEIVSAKNKSGKLTLKSVVIQDGFYVEWMKRVEGEHPCTTRANAPERTIIDGGSRLDFSALAD